MTSHAVIKQESLDFSKERHTRRRLRYRLLMLLMILAGLIPLLPNGIRDTICLYRMRSCRRQVDQVAREVENYRIQYGRLPKELSEIAYSFQCKQRSDSRLLYEVNDEWFRLVCSSHIPISPAIDSMTSVLLR